MERTKNIQLALVILMAAMQAAVAFSIQGNWSLVGIKGIVRGNESVVMRVEDYVFKKQQILQKISLVGCKQVFLQSEVSQDQLFINFKSYFTQPVPNITCGTQNLIDQLTSSLMNVFSFQIQQDVLQLITPNGQPIIRFKKLLASNKPMGIEGIWSINQFGNKSTSLSAQINSTQIVLCQGNLIYNYTLNNNTINLKAVLSKCSSREFTAAFTAVKYFRVFKDQLKLYDEAVALTFQLTYSSPYDPAKPIFAPPKQNQPSPKNTSANASSLLTISVSNLAGRWSIASLFGIPFPQTPYFIVFTPTTIALNGGCSNYSYPYTLNTTSQIITVGNGSSIIPKACSKSDDSLYVSGLTKMNKYLLSSSNGQYALNFYDKPKNNLVYSLRSGAQASAPQVKSQPPKAPENPPSRAPTSPPPLTEGTYLLLLLSRRDLPRLLVKVKQNVLSYKSCNNIEQTFLPAKLTAPKSNISFKGGYATSNVCTVNNDKIYFQTLNSAKSYAFDASTSSIIFSNGQGKEIATLTQSA